jgi:hypothetical protein
MYEITITFTVNGFGNRPAEDMAAVVRNGIQLWGQPLQIKELRVQCLGETA